MRAVSTFYSSGRVWIAMALMVYRLYTGIL